MPHDAARVAALREQVRLLPSEATNGNGVLDVDAEPPVMSWIAPMAGPARAGIVGDLLDAIDPYSEADPAAVVGQFLIGAGNIFGRGPTFLTQADEQRTNLFGLITGPTGQGRKGVSWSWARRPLTLAAPEWITNKCLQAGGLSSGEGLVRRLKDSENDSRLLVHESEFSSALVAGGREGSILSQMIRQGWDGLDLNIMTRKDPIAAPGRHLSLIGHITQEELLQRLGASDRANGFGNRFLYFLTLRQRYLSDPGQVPDAEMHAIGDRLGRLIENARRVGRMRWDAEAAALYDVMYRDQLEAPRPGVFGKVTDRAAAQVVRLSMIYALLDGAHGTITLSHLQSALAVWQYSLDSARFIFGGDLGADPVEERILDYLHTQPTGRAFKTDLYGIFSGHKGRTVLNPALAALVRAGKITIEKVPTTGRPAELVILRTFLRKFSNSPLVSDPDADVERAAIQEEGR